MSTEHTWINPCDRKAKGCDNAACQWCAGGLECCTACGAFEGATPTHCPAEKMPHEVATAVYEGRIDYRDGKWDAGVCEAMSHLAKAPAEPLVTLARDADLITVYANWATHLDVEQADPRVVITQIRALAVEVVHQRDKRDAARAGLTAVGDLCRSYREGEACGIIPRGQHFVSQVESVLAASAA